MINIKRLVITIFLSFNVAFSSPAFVFAEAQSAPEAESAPEASPAPGADTAPAASSAPEPSSTPTPSPSPDALIVDQTDVTPNVISPDEYQSGDQEDEEQEERDRQERIDRYYQYLEDKAEWEKTHNGGNVGNTSIQTGDATVGGAVVNNTNGNYVSSSVCSTCASGQSASVLNEGNGSDSNNSGAVTTNNTNSVVIDNDASIGNNLDFKANAGYNDSSGNVGDTEITTGDANVSGVIINSTNQNNLGIIEYNIKEDHNGDIILAIPDGFLGCVTCGAGGDQTAENSGNGADSTNDAAISSNNETNIDIDNNGDVVNNMNLAANSGYNNASKNVGDSTITTGDANVAANVINMLNSTIGGGVAFVVNVFGNLVGDIIFPDVIPGSGGSGLLASNTGNGAGSANDATIDNNNVTDVNFDNYADIDNNLNIYANTGINDTNKNTGGNNSIETGDVDVNAEVLTVANTNYFGTSDEPLWLLLVNNMGSWTGQIIGALSGQNYSGSEGLVFNVDENGDIIATNSRNGADSTNNAAIANNNNTNIDINNNANLVNNIYINANTGHNEADRNTGGNSTIKTGDANVAASIINFVNTNLIGRNVMIGIVNVFGSWFGDAVPPGEEPDGQSNLAVGGANVQGQSSNDSANTSGGVTGGSNSNSSSSSNQTIATSNANSGKSGGFPFGAIFGGSDDNSDMEGGAGGSDQGAQVLGSAETLGLINIRFNLKLLALSLLPFLAFGILRYRQLSKKNRINLAVAHQIRKPRP